MNQLRILLLAATAVAAAGCTAGIQGRVNIGAHPCDSPRKVVQVPITVGGGIGGLAVGAHSSGRPDQDWRTGEERPLPGAKIYLRPLGEPEELQATVADADGRFALVPVPPGWYQIEACFPGFFSTWVPLRVSAESPSKELVLGLELAE